MTRLDKCTKCDHAECFHRQRDVRMWALDECNISTCYCYKFSSNKKFIDKFTRQGIPLVLPKDEQSRYVWDIMSRMKLHDKALSLLKNSTTDYLECKT